MSFILVYIVCADEDEAEEIARSLLEERLIACANIFPSHSSLYVWEGETRREKETAMLVKTAGHLFPSVEAVVLRLHSYKTPAIIGLPIEALTLGFAHYLRSQLREDSVRHEDTDNPC